MLVSVEQSRAVSYIGHATIVAVPGSGKTRTLIAKAVAMVKAGYTQIGIVSFTNASAKELRQRLHAELTETVADRVVTVATFHSMMLNHISGHVSGMGLVSHQFETTHMLSVLKKHGLKSADLDDFSQYLNAESSERLETDRFFEPWSDYLNELLQNQQITLSNVIEFGLQMIVAGKLPPLPFTDIFVDEFQDTDEPQLKLLLAHAMMNINIIAVGDDDQAIYKFRGGLGVRAFWTLMDNVKGQEFVLSTNYRSHSEITDFANAIIQSNKQRIAKTLHSAKGPGGVVSLTRYATPYDEAESVCASVKRVFDDEDGDIFIIARSNAALDIYREMLTVPYDDLAAKNREPYESQIAKSGLRALVDRDINQLCITLSVFMSTDLASRVSKAALSKAQFSGQGLQHVQSLRQVVRSLANSQAEAAIEQYMSYVTPHLMDMANDPKRDQEGVVKARGFTQRTLARTEEILLKLRGSVKQRLDVLARKKEEANTSRLKLVTMHGSKGLEAETVFAVGISHGKVPSAMAVKEARGMGAKYHQQLLEEERRLLFVTVTRAMKALHVSAFAGTAHRPSANGYSNLIPLQYIEDLPSIHRLTD